MLMGFFKVINKGIDMKKVIIATFVGALALPVLAQMTPVGVWRTYDAVSYTHLTLPTNREV